MFNTFTIFRLDLRRTSPNPGSTSSDEMLALSERKVLVVTFLEEKLVGRTDDKPGLAGILSKSSKALLLASL